MVSPRNASRETSRSDAGVAFTSPSQDVLFDEVRQHREAPGVIHVEDGDVSLEVRYIGENRKIGAVSGTGKQKGVEQSPRPPGKLDGGAPRPSATAASR